MNIQWRRVTKGLPQMTSNPVLGRKIQLLEELGGYGDAAGGPDALEGIVLGIVGARGGIVVRGSVAVAAGEILLQGVVCTTVGGYVVFMCHLGSKEAGAGVLQYKKRAMKGNNGFLPLFLVNRGLRRDMNLQQQEQ